MNKIAITTGLLVGLAFTVNAQVTPDPSHQQPGVQTPGTPPTFPTDRQDTAKDRQDRNQSDADTQNTDRDRQHPQSTDRDDQIPAESGRDYDRDRQNGSVGSNAGQQDQDRDRQDRDRNDDPDRGLNPDRDHRSDYQSQLQNALQQNPNLSGVQVNYTDRTVELTGTVPTGKEKHEARMIAQDYANGRKVVDHITVTGRGH